MTMIDVRVGTVGTGVTHALDEDDMTYCGWSLAAFLEVTFWGRADEVNCPNCQKKFNERGIDMAAKKETTSQSLRMTTCPTRTTAAEKGDLLTRECMDKGPHAPHGWHSYVMEGDRWCLGTGKPSLDGFSSNTATGSSTKTYGKSNTTWVKPKKDYSTGWRADYTTEIGVKEARKIAFDMHADQKDKSGEPYAKHLEAVRLGVVVLGGSVEEQVAALFHDAVEDFHTTYDMLRKIGCTEATITMVEAVSKRTSEEQGLYLERIIKAGAGAMRVKVADLLHNMRHDRLQALADDKKQYTVDRLHKKYRPALARLLMELSLIVDVDEQKKIATKPVGSSTGSTWSGTSYGTTTVSYDVDNLLPGDWITATSAPIRYQISADTEANKGKGEVTYLLCNGEVYTEELKWTATGVTKKKSVYPQKTWVESTTIKFTGVTETDIADFIEILDSDVEDDWVDAEEVVDADDAKWDAKEAEILNEQGDNFDVLFSEGWSGL